ncbi:MAG: glutamine amidotransferase [Symploca sp. SIO2D2]|nr:glutamine amidotransferase [Symploca sp. SIO2D2]
MDDRVTQFVQQHEIPFQILRPFAGDALPSDDAEIGASVIYGGSFNVYEEEKYPFLHEENRWIESCLKREIPLLGICQGAQSIARVLGAFAGPLPEERCEFGSYPIVPTEAGSAYFPEKLFVPESHYHEFHIPAGAERLAYSENFERQAMKYGKNAYAFQFHPELTPEGFKRLQKRNTHLYAMPGSQGAEEQNKALLQHDEAMETWLESFMRIFLSDLLEEK